jgi:hypothetical protein
MPQNYKLPKDIKMTYLSVIKALCAMRHALGELEDE